MPTRLNDTRELAEKDPAVLMATLACTTIGILREAANRDAQIARITSRYQEAVNELTARRDAAAAQLDQLIWANRADFDKPRAKTTPHGQYGLRTVTNVEITDAEQVIAWADENGHEDLVKREPVIQKPAVGKRLKAGEIIPGAALKTGEVSFYKINTKLLDQAQAAQEGAQP